MDHEYTASELIERLKHIEQLLVSITSTFGQIEIENKEQIQQSISCIKTAFQALMKCVGK